MMDKKELHLEEMEKIVGGMELAFVTVPAADISVILNEAWQLKNVKHYTKEQAIQEICAGYRPVQHKEVSDIIDQYWDRLK